MKKSQLLELQNEILEGKGVFKIYAFFLIFSLVIIAAPEEPILAYFPQLILEAVGIVTLLVVYFGCKAERSKKNSRTIVLYLLALIILTASTISLFFR